MQENTLIELEQMAQRNRSVTTFETQIVKNSTDTNKSKTIAKYDMEMIHINKYIDMQKQEQKQKLLNAMNNKSEYCHQKIMELSNIGLSVANGDYYLIPYGDSINFDIDYKGMLKIASIEAKKNGYQLIAKADTIRDGFTRCDVTTNGLIDNVVIENGKINGNIVTSYAILALISVKTQDVIMQKVEILPINEYNNAVKASKSGSTYKNYNTEMSKKIALRRSVKILNTMFASDILDRLFALDNESYDLNSQNLNEDNSNKKDINDLHDKRTLRTMQGI